MTARVKVIAEQVMALPQNAREEFLSWLADFERSTAMIGTRRFLATLNLEDVWEAFLS